MSSQERGAAFDCELGSVPQADRWLLVMASNLPVIKAINRGIHVSQQLRPSAAKRRHSHQDCNAAPDRHACQGDGKGGHCGAKSADQRNKHSLAGTSPRTKEAAASNGRRPRLQARPSGISQIEGAQYVRSSRGKAGPGWSTATQGGCQPSRFQQPRVCRQLFDVEVHVSKPRVASHSGTSPGRHARFLQKLKGLPNRRLGCEWFESGHLHFLAR